jgi:hypothetical protein
MMKEQRIMPKLRMKPERRIRPLLRIKSGGWASSAVKALSAVLVSSVVMASSAFADTSGAAFLQIGDGARPLALAGAYTAAAGSVDSIYYNPGGLASLDGKELSLTHSDWLEGTTFDVVSYGHSTAFGTLALSALRLGGTQEGRDINRLQTANFTTEDIAATLSYAKSLGSFVGAGANVKFLHSAIASDSASTYAVDFGATARVPGQHLQFGATALNIGSGLRFVDQVDRLPLTLAIGSSYQPIAPLTFSLDFKHQPYDSFSELDAGAEYGIGPFALRAGYAAPVQGVDTSLSAMDHFRGGIGIQISRYRADYTLAPFGDLGLTQRFTLSIKFGEEAGQPKNLEPHARGNTNTREISSLFF